MSTDESVSGKSGLEGLFFELASESRLNILHELQSKNLRMQEIARRVGITPTEAFRQLDRLSAASLVQRHPDGSFALAEYGKLVLQVSTSLDFVSKHKEYFSTHDLMKLPSQFLNRLGQLSRADLEMDTIETLNKGSKAFKEAKEYIWALGESTIPEQMVPVVNELIGMGLEFKVLITGSRLPAGVSEARTPRNVETRALPDCPVVIALTEKAAAVTFRQIGGRVDYAGFFGSDPQFHEWVRDLFQYYWDKGRRVSEH
jgi:predicted transcriptional regulator